ncbi:MAG: hypothetical protein KDK62_06790 [Chlamydiia bacterium]|nr:hypothetical protein [Chlamydiia bacterium]
MSKLLTPCQDELKAIFSELKTAEGDHKEYLLDKLGLKIYVLMMIIFHDQRLTEIKMREMAQNLAQKMVKKVQSDMISPTQLTISVVAGSLQIISGSAIGASHWMGDTAKMVGKGAGAAGQGLGSFGLVAGSFKDSNVAGSQYTLETAKQRREMNNESGARSQQERDRLGQAMHQHTDSRHQAFQEMAR